jgi:hypothetical protein
MQFDGQVWFDFGTKNVWHFYRFIRALAAAGHTVALEWIPLPEPQEQDAMEVFWSLPTPEDRGRFLHAMLGLVNIEDQAPSSADTVEKALAASGLMRPTDGVADLGSLRETAEELGIHAVPTMYRHGPVVAIGLNGAAVSGDVERRARLILDMLDDDGVWSLQKP